MICAEPGCERGPLDEHGTALFRINKSGPGAGFVGMCREHYDKHLEEHGRGPIDPVVSDIAETIMEDNRK